MTELTVITIPAEMEEDMEVHVFSIPGDYPSTLDMFYDRIKCRLVTVVHAELEDRSSVDLWVDDEGLLTNDPLINLRASLLAGQSLFGNAVVALSDNGETTSITEQTASSIEATLMSRLSGMLA